MAYMEYDQRSSGSGGRAMSGGRLRQEGRKIELGEGGSGYSGRAWLSRLSRVLREGQRVLPVSQSFVVLL
jgi:hypothetical protein